MKITGKLLRILFLYTILAVSANAETIQFGRKRNNKKESNINAAQIKGDETGVASASYSNLPKNEVINTFYADPLSDEFMGKDSTILDAERNRSTKDLLSEFNGQVKEINDNTEIPDEDELVDEHSKEDRARIEARADQLLKEAAIEESKNNTGEALLENSSDKISEKLKEKDDKQIASFTDLYKENASETIDISENKSSDEKGEASKLAVDMPEEDPEFSNKTVGEEVVIVEEKDTEEKIDVPDYEKLKGIVSADEIEDDSSSKKKKKRKEEEKESKTAKTSKKNIKLRKMSEPMEPVLLTDGKPKSLDDESEKVYTYSGLLIPEKQPLGRKKHMLRWVLKLDDGTRIPLKSNLKLMQEVRKENNLDDFVTISGKIRTSAMEKELRYLVPDSIVKGGKPNVSKDTEKNKNEADIKADENQKIESENKIVNETLQETASDTIDLKEVSQLPEEKDSLQTAK